MQEIIEHTREPYRVYAIQLDPGVNKRAQQSLLTVHIGRPVSFKSVVELFILQHLELTIVSSGAGSGEKILTSSIVGIQKIANGAKPQYELTLTGNLLELRD